MKKKSEMEKALTLPRGYNKLIICGKSSESKSIYSYKALDVNKKRTNIIVSAGEKTDFTDTNEFLEEYIEYNFKSMSTAITIESGKSYFFSDSIKGNDKKMYGRNLITKILMDNKRKNSLANDRKATVLFDDTWKGNTMHELLKISDCKCTIIINTPTLQQLFGKEDTSSEILSGELSSLKWKVVSTKYLQDIKEQDAASDETKEKPEEIKEE